MCLCSFPMFWLVFYGLHAFFMNVREKEGGISLWPYVCGMGVFFLIFFLKKPRELPAPV